MSDGGEILEVFDVGRTHTMAHGTWYDQFYKRLVKGHFVPPRLLGRRCQLRLVEGENGEPGKLVLEAAPPGTPLKRMRGQGFRPKQATPLSVRIG